MLLLVMLLLLLLLLVLMLLLLLLKHLKWRLKMAHTDLANFRFFYVVVCHAEMRSKPC